MVATARGPVWLAIAVLLAAGCARSKRTDRVGSAPAASAAPAPSAHANLVRRELRFELELLAIRARDHMTLGFTCAEAQDLEKRLRAEERHTVGDFSMSCTSDGLTFHVKSRELGANVEEAGTMPLYVPPPIEEPDAQPECLEPETRLTAERVAFDLDFHGSIRGGIVPAQILGMDEKFRVLVHAGEAAIIWRQYKSQTDDTEIWEFASIREGATLEGARWAYLELCDDCAPRAVSRTEFSARPTRRQLEEFLDHAWWTHPRFQPASARICGRAWSELFGSPPPRELPRRIRKGWVVGDAVGKRVEPRSDVRL